MPLSDIFRNAIPINARMLLGTMLGSRAPITEKDLSPAELQVLADVIASKKHVNEINERWTAADLANPATEYDDPAGHKAIAEKLLATFSKDRAKTSIGYDDYPGDRLATSDGMGATLWRSFTDPAYRMATTLGRFNAYDTPQGTEIRDKYNFDTRTYIGDRSLGGLLRNSSGPLDFFDNYMNTRNPGATRDVNIRLPPAPMAPLPVQGGYQTVRGVQP